MKWDRPTLPGVDDRAGDFMPAKDEIPAEFFDRKNEWNVKARIWVHTGFRIDCQPKPGINLQIARIHLPLCYANIFSPYDTVVAACAYLMSLWFESPVPVKPAKRKLECIECRCEADPGYDRKDGPLCRDCHQGVGPGEDVPTRLRGRHDAF